MSRLHEEITLHIKRTITKTIKNLSDNFPVLLLTGPRQVGKTTLLEDCKEEGRGYVTLDDLEQRALAISDPVLFLQTHKAPVIIDEVQYAPQLFSAIKIIVDQDKRPGLFWLTGSQKFHLMQGISETLAGRVAICDMLGLSQVELYNKTQQPFLPTHEWVEAARPQSKAISLNELYRIIWLGSLPKIQTYIQRDVQKLTKVVDYLAFSRFLRAVAARTGQLINYADLGRDVDVDQKTIKEWLSILEASGLVYLLQPYHNNITNRIIKTPKLYFLDTGLCAYLTKWTSPETLEAGAMSGAILETYMFSEILKSYWHNGKAANFYFYRDFDQKEIDLLIEQDGKLYPIEFKKSASPSISAAKNFNVLAKLNLPMGEGAVICMKDTDIPLSKDVVAIPVWYL